MRVQRKRGNAEVGTGISTVLGRTQLAFLVLVFASALQAQSDAPVQPAHVGVIKLKLVYENLQETIDAENAIDDQQKQLQTMTDTHRSQLKQLQDQITDPKTRGAADRESVVNQLDKQTFEFNFQEQTAQSKILHTKGRQMVKGFEEIKAAVNDLATSRGLDLVIVDGSQTVPPNVADMANTQNLGKLLLDRNVLHTADSVDITADVIRAINKNYKSILPPKPSPALPTTSMQIGSKTFQIEIAGDDTSKARGLMERDSIPADHGMIFVFATAQEQTFWMHHTRFPLDIVYADGTGRVVSVKAMKAYDETPVPSDGAAKYAIELPAGSAMGIKIGDPIKIPAAVDAALK